MGPRPPTHAPRLAIGTLPDPAAHRFQIEDDTDADFLMRVWLRESTRQCVLGVPRGVFDAEMPGFSPSRFHDVRRAARIAFYTVF